MHRRAVRSLSLFACLVLGGCGAKVADDPRLDPTAADPVPLERWCEAVAQNECARLVPCCNAVHLDADLAKCHANFVRECNVNIEAHLRLGRTYDPRAAGICIAGDEHLYDGCRSRLTTVWSTPIMTERVRSACLHVWTGSAPLGGACKSTGDCAKLPDGRPLRCDSTAELTCQLDEHRKLGEACGRPPGGGARRHCESGLVCLPPEDSSGESRCVQRASLGQPCRPSIAATCSDGLTCDPVRKTCSTPLPLGAACFPSTGGLVGTLDPICAAPNECHSTTHVCTAPKALGEPCDPAADALESIECGHASYCDPTARVCTPRRNDGSTCESATECIGYICTAGRCVQNNGVALAGTCRMAGYGTW